MTNLLEMLRWDVGDTGLNLLLWEHFLCYIRFIFYFFYVSQL